MRMVEWGWEKGNVSRKRGQRARRVEEKRRAGVCAHPEVDLREALDDLGKTASVLEGGLWSDDLDLGMDVDVKVGFVNDSTSEGGC